MPFTYRRRTHATRPVVGTRAAAAPRTGIFGRRRRAAPRAVPVKHSRHTRTHAAPAHHSHRHAAPVHRQQRRPTMKDKLSGALLKLKGSLTHRPAVKVCISP